MIAFRIVPYDLRDAYSWTKAAGEIETLAALTGDASPPTPGAVSPIPLGTKLALGTQSPPPNERNMCPKRRSSLNASARNDLPSGLVVAGAGVAVGAAVSSASAVEAGTERATRSKSVRQRTSAGFTPNRVGCEAEIAAPSVKQEPRSRRQPGRPSP